jgi:hypothetical protein
MSGAIPPLPQYAFMVWCSVKAQGQLLLMLYLNNNGKEQKFRPTSLHSHTLTSGFVTSSEPAMITWLLTGQKCIIWWGLNTVEWDEIMLIVYGKGSWSPISFCPKTCVTWQMLLCETQHVSASGSNKLSVKGSQLFSSEARHLHKRIWLPGLLKGNTNGCLMLRYFTRIFLAIN